MLLWQLTLTAGCWQVEQSIFHRPTLQCGWREQHIAWRLHKGPNRQCRNGVTKHVYFGSTGEPWPEDTWKKIENRHCSENSSIHATFANTGAQPRDNLESTPVMVKLKPCPDDTAVPVPEPGTVLKRPVRRGPAKQQQQQADESTT